MADDKDYPFKDVNKAKKFIRDNHPEKIDMIDYLGDVGIRYYANSLKREQLIAEEDVK